MYLFIYSYIYMYIYLFIFTTDFISSRPPSFFFGRCGHAG